MNHRSLALALLVAATSCAAPTANDTAETQADGITVMLVPDGEYVFTSALTGKCLDVPAASRDAGALLHAWTCNGSVAQVFRLRRVDAHYYSLISPNSGLAISVPNGGGTGTQLAQLPYVGGHGQQISLVVEGDGLYSLHFRESDEVVDIRSSGTDDGTPIQRWPANGSVAQKWRLVGRQGAPQQPPMRADAPPVTWQEHWGEHKQLLKLAAYNDDVAVYFDDDVKREKTAWILPYMTRVWQYTKRTYGNFGPDGRLYAIFHTNKYGGGHPATYFDSSHDNRNTIDCGYGDWDAEEGWRIDGPTHEVGHLVEFASKGRSGSPGFRLWNDSKWIEAYGYDVQVGIGNPAVANRLLGMMNQNVDDFPRGGSRWFRDWYYPIWKDHGQSRALAKFFELLAAHFPANSANYARDLNWGEYVHFMSGAAGVDVRPIAERAFGWPGEWDAQLQKARREFPGVKY